MADPNGHSQQIWKYQEERIKTRCTELGGTILSIGDALVGVGANLSGFKTSLIEYISSETDEIRDKIMLGLIWFLESLTSS